jgi:hypothetical protein
MKTYKASRTPLRLVGTSSTLLALGMAALAFAPAARAQTTWQPEAYRQPEATVRPKRLTKSLTEPEGPFFAWDALPVGIAAEVQTSWLQDSAARRLVGKGAPTSAGVSLFYEALRPTPRTAAKLDFGWTSSSTSRGQSGTSNLEKFQTDRLALGLSLRYQVFRWLGPYARVAGGIGWDRVSLGNDSTEMKDSASYAHGSLGGGLFLRSVGLCLRPSPTPYCAAFVAHVEGGYSVGTSSTFSLNSSAPSGVASPIPIESVPLGDMARHAPYLRISAGIAF